MPGISEYKKGFGFYEGLEIAHYRLVKIDIKHIMVSRYRLYKYPLRLTWQAISSQANPDQLLSQLETMTRGNRIIMSSYGNPYSCHLDEMTYIINDDEVIVDLPGSCRRM